MKPSFLIAAVAVAAAIGVGGTYLSRKNSDAKVVATAPGPYSVAVRANGVRNANGQIVVTLCTEGQEFPTRCTVKQAVQAKAGETLVQFDHLAAGSYAVALFHDENADGALSFQQEGIGFSHNANLEFSMPDFSKSAFRIPEEPNQTINVRYYN